MGVFMANNPRWLSLLEKIAASWDDGDRSLKDNTVDKQVHSTILETLLMGKPLSAKQSAALIRSIQRRVPFQSQFTYAGQIVLTRKQVRYANATTIKKIRAAFATVPKGFAADNLSGISPQFVTPMSAQSPAFVANSPSISPDLSHNPLNQNGISRPTKRNPHFASLNSDTPRNETKQEEASDKSPRGTDVATQHQSTGAITLERSAHSTASPSVFGEIDVVGEIKLGEVSLWLNQGMTGTIYVDGIKRQLDFRDHHFFENKFFNSHKNDGFSSWWSSYMNAFVADLDTVFQSDDWRAKEARSYKMAVSGIYASRGSFKPIASRLVARLLYEDETPTHISVLAGQTLHVAGVTENQGKNADSPHWRASRWKSEPF